jgi:DNA mismatch repair protein MutL
VDSVIAVLPPAVIDQIAAGEVIERPASVVKELVDNALDAGARLIAIETLAGGRSLVRVTDDGGGMSPKDALLALERHATSKLRTVDDLWGIASMGFRGEALAAISSVSRFTLTTRRAADLAATRVVIDASRLVAVTDAAHAAGTTIEVADLLHNLPARLKFLKGEGTEASHITELVAKLAMAHPHIHFRLKHNNRTALELPPDRDGLARARALLGPRISQRLVATAGEEAGMRVTAYLGSPDLAQTTARGVQIFVGRRPVRDRTLLHALTMGYGELVPRGRYPVAVLLIDAPAGSVDVNVHPQKQEVRFSDPNAIGAAVRHVIQAGIAEASWRHETGIQPVQMIASVAPPALPLDGRPATALSERFSRDLRRSAQTIGQPPSDQAGLFDDGGTPAREWAAQIHHKTRAAKAAERRAELRETVERDSPLARQPFVSDDDLARRREIDARADASLLGESGARADAIRTRADEIRTRGEQVDARAPQADAGWEPAASPADAPQRIAEGSGPSDAAMTSTGYWSRLRFLGQLDLTYFVCEASGELVLVDQHAAHERVELARLLARHTASDVAVQRMLFPVTIEATPSQLALVERVTDVLAEVGYEAERFGKTTLAIKAVPAGIRHGDPAQLLRRMLASWERDGMPDEDERVARVLAEIACHSVVRAGDRLTAGEAEALLRSLEDVDPTTPMPHGKALLLRLPLAEIGRRFGRS